MSRPPRHRSLRQRLSWWLALQSLAGLGLVCLVVYVVTEANFHERQEETLSQKEAVIRHLLTDGREHKSPLDLAHELDDFLIGHGDLSLQVSRSDGAQVYAHTRNRNAGTVLRERNFQVGQALGPDSRLLQVTLSLDIQTDSLLLYRLRLTLLLAALAGAATITVGGFFLVKLGLAPVGQLADQARSLSARNLHHRLDSAEQPLELVPLIGQFNALLARIEAAYTQMEGFNADVAHELCTPLATLTTSNELALRCADSEDTAEVLASNLEELQRLTGIVNDMLFLSQADRGVEARRTTVDRLAALASGVLDYHEAALAEAHLSAEVQGDAAGLVDGALLRRALSNLLGNATRYATPGSVIVVRIAQPEGPSRVRLEVTNQGPALDPDSLSHFFDRFFRADPSRTLGQVNHGLGLAIVAGIARMHGGQPFAVSESGVTTVGIDIPVA